MHNKTLFIVEGESDEPAFIKQLFLKCNKKEEYHTYSYRANIHMLAKELMNNYPDFDEDNIDIKLVLKSIESDENKKKILDDNYNDIYLIFDFEPQHDDLHFDIVKKMMVYFNDSTQQGKLFINYPMMQSYKHFSVLPDSTFEYRMVNTNRFDLYKKDVGDMSKFTDLSQYNYSIFYSLTVHHLRKYNKICFGKYDILDVDTYLKSDSSKVFDIEVKKLKNEGQIDVLNTCIFALIDFAPSNFYNFINKKHDELMI